MPTFSILVPCYNHARYVGAALDSLIAQTDPDWEAVVVNDGSTDDSPGVLDAYARRDPRIRVFHKPNGGVSSALNRAIAEARGDWLCWLSSDDLYEPDKLAVHREWFRREVECRFFFTHYRGLNDATGEITDPDLWQPLPERDLQIIRLMRGNYIPGIGICVRREAVIAAGSFDEELRVSQDYDLWLRLLAIAPAVFIPERTCISRVHPGQDSKTQRERCFREASEACIAFLNRHRLDEFFPAIDWNDQGSARTAVVESINVAANPHAFVYGLGVHLALIHRIMEWLWAPERVEWVGPLRDYFRARARTTSRSQEGTDLGFLWRIAFLASHRDHPCPYSEVDARMLSDRFASDAAPDGWKERSPWGHETSSRYNGELTFVCAPDASLDTQPYGAMRMSMVMARAMQQRGCRCVLMGLSRRPIGTVGAVPFVGAPDDVTLLRNLRRFSPIAHIVANSRDDVFAHAFVRRATIYHHNLSPVLRCLPVRTGVTADVSVACVSEYSRQRVLDVGLPSARVVVVPNTYDRETYRPIRFEERDQVGIVFAGTVCRGKGVDIALRVFEQLATNIPSVRLHIYGKESNDWTDGPHELQPEWLTSNGCLDWSVIGAVLKGVYYHGEVTPAALALAFTTNSVIVIPSRSENFPLVSLEAQACGCLPVAFNVGGVSETFLDLKTGHLCAENTAAGMTAVLSHVLGERLITAGLRDFSARRVAKLYSPERSANAFVKALVNAGRIGTRGQVACWKHRMFARLHNKRDRMGDFLRSHLAHKAPSGPDTMPEALRR